MDLDGTVDDAGGHCGHDDLCGGDQVARGLVALAVHLFRGPQRQQARLLDLAPGMGDILPHRSLFAERLAERNARLRAGAHQFERALRAADQAHAVMDTAGTEPSLRDLEAAAFAEQHVGGGHAHIVVDDLGMADRRIVISEHAHVADDPDPRRVPRHQHHRLLQMLVGIVRVGLAHHDQQLAILAHRARREPLAAVDDVFVAVAANAALDVGGIARRDFRLGHREGRADFARQQRLEPAFLLF